MMYSIRDYGERERQLGPTVGDEMMVVLAALVHNQSEPIKFPPSIDVLGAIISANITEFYKQTEDPRVFRSVDEPRIAGESSMAVLKALGNLRSLGVLNRSRSGVTIDLPSLEKYSGGSLMVLTTTQQEQLSDFSKLLREVLTRET